MCYSDIQSSLYDAGCGKHLFDLLLLDMEDFMKLVWSNAMI